MYSKKAWQMGGIGKGYYRWMSQNSITLNSIYFHQVFMAIVFGGKLDTYQRRKNLSICICYETQLTRERERERGGTMLGYILW